MALAVGCSSLPPAQPAADLKAIAGEWRGTAHGRDGWTRDVTMTITEDGRYTTVTDQPLGQFGTTFPGTEGRERAVPLPVRENRQHRHARTLHEGQGKRVLTSHSDNGISAADLVPSRQ